MAEATGLRNNALPYPVYACPYGVSFPILDADGDLVTGATGLDSEVSKNGDTFADATNEATEIATSSGVYYLLLTATEMTADVVSVIVKTSSSGAKTTVLTLYPRKLPVLSSGTCQGSNDTGDIQLASGEPAINDYFNGCLCVATIDSTVEARIINDYVGSTKVAEISPAWNTAQPDSDDTYVIYQPEGWRCPDANVKAWNGTAVPSEHTAGYPIVTVKDGTGTGEINTNAGAIALVDLVTTTTTVTNLHASAATAAELAKVPKSDSNVTWNATALASIESEATDALQGRGVTSARMGYVDNLNIGGNVASSTEVTSIQNNTRVVRVVPEVIERPDSGTATYRIELLLYDTVGNMEAPDSAPTIALVDQGGTDLSSRLDSTTMALVSTGRYRAIYTASVGDDLEQLVWTFSVVEGGATRLYGNNSVIVDTTAVDFTSADRTKLEAVYNKLPSKTYLTGTTNSDGDIQQDEATGGLSTQAKADVNAEADQALADYDAPTNAEMVARTLAAASYATAANQTTIISHLTDVKGATFDGSTDSLEAIRNRGDIAWITATSVTVSDKTGFSLINVNGVTFADYMESILAVLFGVATPSGSTVAFKKRDGTTTKVTITYGASDGQRTGSVIS